MPDSNPGDVVVRWWNEVLGRGRLDLVDELIGDTYISHTLDGTRTRTRAQLKTDLVPFARALHGSAPTIDDQAVSGEMVWSRITTRGVDPSSGEPVTISWLTASRVRDGRLAESWVLHAPGVDWNRGG